MNSFASAIYKIKEAHRKGRFLKRCQGAFVTRRNRVLYTISPLLLARIRFLLARRRWPNLDCPETFAEKLLWLMLFSRDPLRTRCANKYTVRSYVEELGLRHLLLPLLGTYQKSSDIDFSALPSSFVLKAAHGSGMNIFCRNKHELNIPEVRCKLDAWLQTDYSKKRGEIHYAAMKPLILCEPLLMDVNERLPTDYKLFCFDGKVECTLICPERNPDENLERDADYYFYDRDWERKLPYSRSSLLSSRHIPKPAGYEEMIEAAEKLSKPFPFVRADFYSIKGRVIFGEMTFTPAACIDCDNTDLAEQLLGALIKLPGNGVIKRHHAL